MKILKYLCLAILAVCPFSGQAQGVHRINTVLVKASGTIQANVVPQASIKVCVAGTNCGSLQTVYSDLALTHVLLQPIVANGSGSYDYYFTQGCVDEQISSPNQGVIKIINVCQAATGGGGGGCTAGGASGTYNASNGSGGCIATPASYNSLESGTNSYLFPATVSSGTGGLFQVVVSSSGTGTAGGAINLSATTENPGDEGSGGITLTAQGAGPANGYITMNSQHDLWTLNGVARSLWQLTGDGSQSDTGTFDLQVDGSAGGLRSGQVNVFTQSGGTGASSGTINFTTGYLNTGGNGNFDNSVLFNLKGNAANASTATFDVDVTKGSSSAGDISFETTGFFEIHNLSAGTCANGIALDTDDNLVMVACGGGGGGLSFSPSSPSTNVITKVTGSATVGASALSDDGTTVTSTEPVSITGSTHGITIAAGTAVSGVTGKVIYASDATNGFAEVNENNTGLSRICTSGNGICTGSGNTTSTSLTTNKVSKANGANSIIDSSVSDNGTVVSTPETVSAAGFTATGNTWPGYEDFGQGASSLPAQLANSVRLYAPASVASSIALQLPGTLPGTNGFAPTYNTDGTFDAWAAVGGGSFNGGTITTALTDDSIVSGTTYQFNAKSTAGGTVAGYTAQGHSADQLAFFVEGSTNTLPSALLFYDITSNLGPMVVYGHGGVQRVTLNASTVLNWTTDTSFADTGSPDTGFSRDSAGVVDLGNGTAGNKSGSLNLTNLTVTGTCTGCAPTPIVNIQITLPTSAIAANTCTSPATATMTGLATTSAFMTAFATNPNAVVGWGTSGGLVLTAWPTSNTLNWSVCNQTASSITPGAMTLNVGAR